MAKYKLDLDKWVKNYRYKLVWAWRNGFDDHETAERCGISYEEYAYYLSQDERLTQIRDKYVDELRRIARDNVAAAIRDSKNKDHLKASEWYLEHRDPEFGAKSRYEDLEVEDTVEERRKKNQEAMDKFMANFDPKEDMFDGGR